MRPKTAALAGLLAAAIPVIGMATPARAASTGTLELTCSTIASSKVYRLSFTADYVDSSATGLRTWTVFRYLVHGGRYSEVSSNVNIRLSEYSDRVYTYNSPDNREYNRWYALEPADPVRTTAGRDHRTNALLEVEAIFDREYTGGAGSDPRCSTSKRTQ
jgi:hypothetical protein